MIVKNIANDLIQTADLWCWKRPLYQLASTFSQCNDKYSTYTYLTINQKSVDSVPRIRTLVQIRLGMVVPFFNLRKANIGPQLTDEMFGSVTPKSSAADVSEPLSSVRSYLAIGTRPVQGSV